MSKLKDEKKAKGSPDYLWSGAFGKARVKKTETTVSSGFPQLQPAGVRVPKKESDRKHRANSMHVSCRFLEKAAGQADDPNRYRVVLLQEGLGNGADGYYYTKNAIKSAVPVFEGKKAYADHPSKEEDEIRPERSVRDIVGHYENVKYQEAEDGTATLEGELVILPGDAYDWARCLAEHAVNFSKKYPDKSFIGLSINGSGDANPMDAKQFLESFEIVPSARAKVEQAVKDGLDEVNVTNLIDSAVSCDLVTEAGAKGKVLELLEADMAKRKDKIQESDKKEGDEAAKKEGEESKKEGADDAADGEKADDEGDDHDDEDQDKALIHDQLKKHGLVKENEEADESTMKAAKHMHAAYKADGMDAKEAAEAAVRSMKCSAAAQDSMKKESEEAAKKEAEKKEADAKKVQESTRGSKTDEIEDLKKENVRLAGVNASLESRLDKLELDGHVDTLLRESGLPRAVTKKFKESAAFKTKKEADEKFKVFMEGYQSTGSGEGSESLESFVVGAEKNEGAGSGEGVSSLADCVEE